MDTEYTKFAGIRVRFKGDVLEKCKNYIDLNITKEEAERLVKFLTYCLEEDKK